MTVIKRQEIRIASPLAHQREALNDPTRFKVWRWGRRAGKTRGACIAAYVGHGPEANGRGFLSGGEILWIPRDYPNADIVWRKEIMRRFGGKTGIHIDKKERRVTVDSAGHLGSLTIMSAENIDSVRGGDWDGVIVDEAAHMDLNYVWHDVVRPGLADRFGWAIIMSTTKGGSYFNELCERVTADELEDWKHWHHTAFDNPEISTDELKAMIAEYKDEVKLKQEVYAELVVPGGMAFGEWNSSVHVTRMNPPREWTWVGTMDWGYVNPGWYGSAALGADTETFFRKELKFQKMEPYDVGFAIGTSILSGLPPHAYIVGDAQMWGREQSEITIADKVQEGLRAALPPEMVPGLIPAPKGPGSRARGVVATHTALAWTPHPDDANKPASPWKAPRLRFHPDCAYAISTIPKLARDPLNSEDVDTKGPDHAWDAVKGLLLLHNPRPERMEPMGDPERHPGLTPQGERKRYSWEPREEPPPGRYQRGVVD